MDLIIDLANSSGYGKPINVFRMTELFISADSAPAIEFECIFRYGLAGGRLACNLGQ